MRIRIIINFIKLYENNCKLANLFLNVKVVFEFLLVI